MLCHPVLVTLNLALTLRFTLALTLTLTFTCPILTLNLYRYCNPPKLT